MIPDGLGKKLQFKSFCDVDFYERVRRLAPRMTLLDRDDRSDLYYYQAPFRQEAIWVVVRSESVLVTYDAFEEDLASVRARTLEALTILDSAPSTDALIALYERSPAHEPCYAAKRPAGAGEFVVWCIAGDWLFQFMSADKGPLDESRFPARTDLLPCSWPESVRESARKLRGG